MRVVYDAHVKKGPKKDLDVLSPWNHEVRTISLLKVSRKKQDKTSIKEERKTKRRTKPSNINEWHDFQSYANDKVDLSSRTYKKKEWDLQGEY